VEDQFYGFPREINSCGYIVDFHEVSSEPRVYIISDRLKKTAVVGRFNGTEDFDVVSKKEMPRVSS
jgi:hypothetical protein